MIISRTNKQSGNFDDNVPFSAIPPPPIAPLLQDTGWIDELQCDILVNHIQSYQDDWHMLMKGCMQWNPVYNLKDLHFR